MRLPRQLLSAARLPRWLSFPRLRGGERPRTAHKPATKTATKPTRKSTLARPTRFTLPAVDLKQAVGIHIGEDEVCVALVAQTLRGPQLRRACRVSLGKGTGRTGEPKRRVMSVDDNPQFTTLLRNSVSGPKRRVMVVDDNRVDRELVRRLFLERDFEVLFAVDGQDALDQLKGTAVDLVVTDLMMPRVDGMGVLKELKSITPWPAVIVMSVYGSMDAEISAAAAMARQGTYAYLGKPVRSNELFEAVDQCFTEQPVEPARRVRRMIVIPREATGNAEEPKRRVMVVDDNPVDRAVVRSMFLKRDFEVLTAVDGRDALDQLKAAAVDLIVTDLMMPRLDGTGLLKELGSITPRPPAIVMSAYGNKDADINTAVEVAKKGAYGYLGKPVGPDQLFEMVGKCPPASARRRRSARWS